jgi:hypothetical protein
MKHKVIYFVIKQSIREQRRLSAYIYNNCGMLQGKTIRILVDPTCKPLGNLIYQGPEQERITLFR